MQDQLPGQSTYKKKVNIKFKKQQEKGSKMNGGKER
jgi:hypothetical protein